MKGIATFMFIPNTIGNGPTTSAESGGGSIAGNMKSAAKAAVKNDAETAVKNDAKAAAKNDTKPDWDFTVCFER
jgi:hypothetical protein